MSAHHSGPHFNRGRKLPFAALYGIEEGDQRLNRLDAGVLTVAVDDLPGQRFCHPNLGRDEFPPGVPGGPQLLLEAFDD